MAKMICTCGEVLSNSEAPNDIELVVYTDREWDKISKGELEIGFKKFDGRIQKYFN